MTAAKKVQVCQVTETQQHLIPSLSALLIDAVSQGASIGFLETLSTSEAEGYWAEVFAALSKRDLSLWIAAVDEQVLGTVQLYRCPKPNGRHRAEVQKLIVGSQYRRRGISTALMQAAEDFATAAGILLLYLDTEVGSTAELVYQKLGWSRSGEIPAYATRPNGDLHPTVYYYKLLAQNSAVSQ